MLLNDPQHSGHSIATLRQAANEGSLVIDFFAVGWAAHGARPLPWQPAPDDADPHRQITAPPKAANEQKQNRSRLIGSY
ncbi:MAG: hypothetical protein WCT12_21915 [Verrucomicrobiota bacterium]